VQVVFDRTRADEQLGGDLRIGLAVNGLAHDLRFLGCQLDGWRGSSLAQPFAGRG
jgi:hypothetical protein